MTRGPSVKALQGSLKIPLRSAQIIKYAMGQGRPIRALEEANAAMGGYGVGNLYPDYPEFYYVNMGDTYSMTLCYTGNSFYIGSWGDWVERHPARGGVF